MNIISHDIFHLFFNSLLYLLVSTTLLRRSCPSAIVNLLRIVNPYEIWALLPVKPEDMPKMSTRMNKQTRASIKYFQEIIQDQAMSTTKCDHNLGYLGIVLWASYLDPLNNRNPLAPPTDTGLAPINVIVTYYQITEAVCI